MSPTAGDPQPLKPVVIRPAAPSDLQGVLHIRQAQEMLESGTPITTADKLAAEWEALGSQLAEHVWVAVAADGSLIACVELHREGEVFSPCLWALPDRRDSELEMALLATAERRAWASARDEGAHSVTLFAQATSTHPTAQQALQQSGFVITSTYEQMELALTEPPSLPDLLPGIEIRPFAVGQDDAAVLHRADEEAFLDQQDHTPRAFEQWTQRLNLSGKSFDPSLWLIAWDADEVAGAALGEIIEDAGWIHHLFVRRPWRRRGLGAALTLSAVGAFYQHGIGAVRLNVDAQSLTNAHQLYRRVGFRVISAYANYEKVTPLA